jgi:DNA-binding NtrC family response regulator
MQNHELIGTSQMMQELAELIRKAAGSICTVLLIGETGSGKEIVARRIHVQSQRRASPFVPVNCAAIPETLIESELFGYEKGAFTGAITRRIGLCEEAEGGTLFLDEVGRLGLRAQEKLFRLMEERTIRRLGGSREISLNVRVISATSRVLEELVIKEQFLPDLYYRLNVFPIRVPPLREHRKDIPSLVEHFLHLFAPDPENIAEISDEAMSLLMNHPWPGNIRELRNTIERALVLSEGQTIETKHIHFAASIKPPSESNWWRDRQGEFLSLYQLEGRYLRMMLAESDSRLEAARKLGITPKTLYVKMKRHRITANRTTLTLDD